MRPINSLKKTRLFIDVTPALVQRPSGVGKLTKKIVKNLILNKNVCEEFDIVLFTGVDKRVLLKKTFGTQSKSKTLPVSNKMLRFLNVHNLLPKIDTFLGKGVYLFFDYYNYPVSSSSLTATFVHDLAYIRHPETVSDKLRKKLSDNMPVWLGRTSVVIAISQFTRREINTYYGIDQNNIHVVYPGVDDNLRNNELNKDFKRKTELPFNSVIHIGNLEPRKNVNLLLDAYVKMPTPIKKEHPLLLIGAGGWKNEQLLSHISEYKQSGENIVIPKEYIDDDELYGLLRESALLVFPSVYEGFGIPPLEAVAVGAKIIASDIPTSREVFGNEIPLFNPLDDDELSKMMTEVIKGDIKIRQPKDVIKKYSWTNSANQLADILHDLITR